MTLPTLRRRRLAAELHRLREEAGLTMEQTAEITDIGKSTLSRVENAQIGAKPVVVRALLAAYQVAGEDAEALLKLAREANKRGWWQPYANVLTREYADYVALESEASALREYEPQFVPGLLQTADYARVVIDAMLITCPREEVERKVQVRMARQTRLTADPPLDFWAIVDEAALRRPAGEPRVMVEQLEHILAAMDLPNVTVQVLPTAVGAHPGMLGSFSIIEFPDRRFLDAVWIEHIGGEMFLEEEADARRCNLVYNHLRCKALDPDASARTIKGILRGYRS